VEELLTTGVDSLQRNDLYDPQWLKIPSAQSRNTFYDEEVRYNDTQLPKLIMLLKEFELWDDTVVVFMADHGEHLGEHNLWGHWAPGYMQVIHVPLILVCPKLLPMNLTVEQPVELVDVMPTILELAGVRDQTLLLAGESLLPFLQNEDAGSTPERISFSEEVRFRTKDDGVGCGSVLWRDLHVLTSDAINDALFARTSGFLKRLSKTGIPTRVFSIQDNRGEQIIASAYGLDVWLQLDMARFFLEFKQRNLRIWDAVTKSADRKPELDPKVIDVLRTLGYVQ
jgi:hypothetical protein